MYYVAHGAMLIALLLSITAAGLACIDAWKGTQHSMRWLVRIHGLTVFLMGLASSMLLGALLNRDFSLSYVAQYTDSTLPLFYTVTAFWAGQAGSLLFWALAMGLASLVFGCSRTYLALSPRTKICFWMFFMSLQAFFLLLLTGPSSPFEVSATPPADGQGLNPLLRNIGMVLHPPLLFAGYAGFAIPACLALAAAMSGERSSIKYWVQAAHNWILVSWVLLTAGILLGGWWAYMELGWGGYWAWDPVENASLIPWFTATALLHTLIAQRRFGVLPRTNVFLACLTLLLCLFATYLVRSGVVQSLHAFGEGGVGRPLLLAVAFGVAVCLAVVSAMPRSWAATLPGLLSKQGLLVMLVWLLMALGLVVLLGTIWPVISQLWESNPKGVTQSFYNAICLPLFTGMAMLLAVAPWFGWKGGMRKPALAGIPVAVWIGTLATGAMLGVTPLLTAAGVGAAAAVVITVILMGGLQPSALKSRTFLASHSSHLAFAIIVFGVAISGPFQKTHEVMLAPGEQTSFGGYLFEYKGMQERSGEEMAIKEAVVQVSKNGRPVGKLRPQQRLYRNFDHPNSEVSTIFSLGEELYATIHDVEGERLRPLKISIAPMVNWVWIGSVAICLLPLLAWRTARSRAQGCAEPNLAHEEGFQS